VGTYTPQALVVRAEGFLWDFLWVFFGRGWGAAEVDIEAGAVLGRSGVGKVGIDSLGEVIKSSHALRGLLFCRFGESDLTLVCLFVCLVASRLAPALSWLSLSHPALHCLLC